MRRNPFAAVAAAVRSLFGAQPKKRTVELSQIVAPTGDAAKVPMRQHFKHGRTSLHWRRHWRPARRAALSLRWSRVMAQVSHPLAAMALRAPKGHPDARRWARNRLKAERAVAS